MEVFFNVKALILVGLQNDFCSHKGAMYIPGSERVINLVNDIIPAFDFVVATRICYPENHGAFARVHGKKVKEKILLGGQEQVLRSDFCVRGSWGAQLVRGLNKKRIDKIFVLGARKNIDSYSAFFEHGHKHSTGLDIYLKERRLKSIFVAGVPLESLVKHTALDGIALGFHTFVIKDACAGIEENLKDSFVEMERTGIRLMDFRGI